MFKITENLIEDRLLEKFKFKGQYFTSEAKEGTEEFRQLIQKFEAGPQFKFRMRDHDQEVYFIGYSDDCTRTNGFDPLDMVGQYYSCIDIQYLNEQGEYVRL
ncbi:MAG: hypothetical protein Q8911_07940 [Bacillota bacterium]|nr:hypothetical protein [Bacillota bacterium]